MYTSGLGSPVELMQAMNARRISGKSARQRVLTFVVASSLFLAAGLPAPALAGDGTIVPPPRADQPEDIRNQPLIDAFDQGWNRMPWGTRHADFKARFPKQSHSFWTDGPNEYRTGEDSESFCGQPWDVRYLFGKLPGAAEPQFYGLVFRPTRKYGTYHFNHAVDFVGCLGPPADRQGGTSTETFSVPDVLIWRSSSLKTEVQLSQYMVLWVFARHLTGPARASPSEANAPKWESFEQVDSVDFQKLIHFTTQMVAPDQYQTLLSVRAVNRGSRAACVLARLHPCATESCILGADRLAKHPLLVKPGETKHLGVALFNHSFAGSVTTSFSGEICDCEFRIPDPVSSADCIPRKRDGPATGTSITPTRTLPAPVPSDTPANYLTLPASEQDVIGRGLDAYRRGDFTGALALFQSLADVGDARAQYLVGKMYEQGKGVPADHVKAAAWYGKAASQGHVKAQSALALACIIGRGVPEDYARATRLARSAAEKGDMAAQFNLAQLLEMGAAGTKNPREALMWFHAAAEQGAGVAQFILANRYYFGTGVAKDLPEALLWMTLAKQSLKASGNSDWEKAEKARNFLISQVTPAQAEDAGRRAAEWQPRPRTDNREPDLPDSRAAGPAPTTDPASMQGASRPATARTAPAGPESMADAAAAGKRGDRETFLRILMTLAEQGNPDAQFNLGLEHDLGRAVPRDYAVAFRWYREAANRGHKLAQALLGVEFELGPHGFATDPVEALKWYSIAALDLADWERQHGKLPVDVVGSRDRLATQLTTEQVTEAQRRTREWRPQP